ncbi:MAG: S8 family serine peptidase [bacterium]|nr:S8 family serine peptidase [bacterium]
MKKFALTFLFTAFTALLLSIAPQSASAQKTAKFRRADKAVPGQYIVVLKQGYIDKAAAEPSVRSNSEYLGYVYGGKVKDTFGRAIAGYVSTMSERQALALSSDERVAYVEQDSYTTVENVQSSAVWGLDRIDQRNAPLDTRYTYATDASNVHAYVIDSGIRTSHASFGGRASSDFDAINDGNQDCLGHGTHVAGTIGSSTWGVAKNARLHSVRVMGCTSSGTVSALIAGIDWVAANRVTPAVANISITASGTSNALNSSVSALVRAGVTVVTSAGNNGADACDYSPANVASAITVGATGSTDLKPTFSNFGRCVDVWAPGIAITSASNGDDTSSRVMNGTSMSSPHVAGVAALYLAANPSASPATVGQNISDTATIGAITNLDAASPNKMVYSWFGGTPPPPLSATVAIRKRANRRTEGVATASFAFNAINLAAPSFTLQPDNTFTDSNVSAFGSTNAITVTESQAMGWQLSSISCNSANSVVDLANRQVSIVAEEGAQIECTFTSDEIAPSSAGAIVSGRVVSMDGRGVRGVTITILDASTGLLQRSITNTFGYYSFKDLPVTHFYVLTAVSTSRYPIRNNVQTFTLSDDLKASSFVTTRN